MRRAPWRKQGYATAATFHQTQLRRAPVGDALGDVPPTSLTSWRRPWWPRSSGWWAPTAEPLAASAMPDELLALAEASARASRSCAPRGPGVNAARMLLSYGATELRSYGAPYLLSYGIIVDEDPDQSPEHVGVAHMGVMRPIAELVVVDGGEVDSEAVGLHTHRP
jgi:hypothetical protein